MIVTGKRKHLTLFRIFPDKSRIFVSAEAVSKLFLSRIRLQFHPNKLFIFRNLLKVTGQVQGNRGGAVSVLKLSPTVIGVGLHRLGLKSIEVKLKSNEAKPSWTST